MRAARIGAYPNAIREYLTSGNYGAAIDLVDQWEDLFATDKLNGHSFYWRGKALALRGQTREAIRYLDRAVRVAPGADWETEGRWLLALALESAGKKDEAKKALSQTFSVVDKMSAKCIIHDNAAGRYKSRLARRVAAK